MAYLNLPATTLVQRGTIYKKELEPKLTVPQRKQLAHVERLTWMHKLSPESVNLTGKQLLEFQVFELLARKRMDFRTLLSGIDQVIPYTIVFAVRYEEEIHYTTAAKHPHPADAGRMVVDYTFRCDWLPHTDRRYQLHLRDNLDTVYLDFCRQLVEHDVPSHWELAELVGFRNAVEPLERQAAKLRAQVLKERQFNRQVELNQVLQKVEGELKGLWEKLSA